MFLVFVDKESNTHLLNLPVKKRTEDERNQVMVYMRERERERFRSSKLVHV